MVTRRTRALAAGQATLDALLGGAAFLLAYAVRFESGIIPAPRGHPPFDQYLALAPAIGLLVVFSYQLLGAYRLRRSRSRVDDFFTTFVGTLAALVVGLSATLYVQVYYASPEAQQAGSYQVSRLAWVLFLGFNVGLTYGSREALRLLMQRRFRAGIGLRRVLIAGTGDLACHVADRFLSHAEFGYQIVGFVDDSGDDRIGYRGLPLLGPLDDAEEILQQERIDQLYVALPTEKHLEMLQLVEAANRECVDVNVIPDFLQFVTLRARLEDLDGIPVINVNDVPLRGLGSVVKRLMDLGLSAAALVVLALPFAAIAAAIRFTSPGPVFYRQERMGLDGRPFPVLKFRSMFDDAERETGPVWTRENDPRRTPVGRFLRRFSLDELPQIWNVLKGEMSVVGPRPERPFFVERFKKSVPQYMLRHKVKAGLTGWAQVNGWRGNTSIEKRIEHDLYYIENWSIALDVKIIWLTLLRFSFHRHAY